MFSIPWYSVLLISVPQTVLIIKIGFGMFGLDVDIKKTILISLFVGIITYFLRLNLIPAGLHTIAIVISIAILATAFSYIPIFHSLVSSLLGSMIFGVIEGIWLPLYLQLTSKTITDLAIHPWLNIIGFIPIILITLVIYLLVIKHNFVLFNLNDKER